MLGPHVLIRAEVPVRQGGRAEGEEQEAQHDAGAERVGKHAAVARIGGREGDGDGLHAKGAEANGVGDADCDIVDGEHRLVVGGASDEQGDRQRRGRKDERTERKRQREAQLLEHHEVAAAGGHQVIERALPGNPALFEEGAHVGACIPPGDEVLENHAGGQRGEAPPGSDKAEHGEDHGEDEGEGDAQERRDVGLAALQIVEEHDHRHVAQEEGRVHHESAQQRPARDFGQMGRKAEGVLEDERVEWRNGGKALQKQQRGHHQVVQPLEGAVAAARASVDHAGHHETAAERADHEHHGLPLCEGRQAVHAEGTVRGDAADERIRDRLGKRLQQQGHVEARDPADAKGRAAVFLGVVHVPNIIA